MVGVVVVVVAVVVVVVVIVAAVVVVAVVIVIVAVDGGAGAHCVVVRVLAGSGVSPENYVGLTRKYHTSKIRSFEDLNFVTSFGFRCVAHSSCFAPAAAAAYPGATLPIHRGEALSSLCEVSGSFTVTTRTAKEPVATCIKYNTRGEIVSKVRECHELCLSGPSLVNVHAGCCVVAPDANSAACRHNHLHCGLVQAAASAAPGVYENHQAAVRQSCEFAAGSYAEVCNVCSTGTC